VLFPPAVAEAHSRSHRAPASSGAEARKWRVRALVSGSDRLSNLKGHGVHVEAAREGAPHDNGPRAYIG
jgi:hypothetical protein